MIFSALNPLERPSNVLRPCFGFNTNNSQINTWNFTPHRPYPSKYMFGSRPCILRSSSNNERTVRFEIILIANCINELRVLLGRKVSGNIHTKWPRNFAFVWQQRASQVILLQGPIWTTDNDVWAIGPGRPTFDPSQSEIFVRDIHLKIPSKLRGSH